MRNETRPDKTARTRNAQRPTLTIEGRGDGKPGRCFAAVTGPQSPKPRARSPAFGRRSDPRRGRRERAEAELHLPDASRSNNRSSGQLPEMRDETRAAERE